MFSLLIERLKSGRGSIAPFALAAAFCLTTNPGFAAGTASSEELSQDEATPDEIYQDLLEQRASGEVRMLRSGRSALLMNKKDEFSALMLFEGQASFRVEVDVFKRPKGLGIDREFAVVTVDGRPEAAYVISSGKPGNSTIEGSYPLKIMAVKGKTNPEFKPYPWKRSTKYNNSPMFWGMQIDGGYWIHSTPHYGELGRPASMGCVRMTYPAAMELWDLIVNRAAGSAVIRIHASGSEKAKAVLASRGVDVSWIRERVEEDLTDALAKTRGDYSGYGHARIGKKLEWPGCDGVDCFDYFGVKKP
jgi:hypothetical protein